MRKSFCLHKVSFEIVLAQGISVLSDGCPAGSSNNTMHSKPALSQGRIRLPFCSLNCLDTLVQRLIFHRGCIPKLSVVPSLILHALDLELSTVITPAFASWLHKLKSMNFKLKFLTFIFLQCRRRTKKRIFGRLYLHETGNATHEQQVPIWSQKKWLAMLGSCLVLLALHEKRCSFHGGWHSLMRVMETEWKASQALLCLSPSGLAAGQVGFQVSRLKMLRHCPLAILLSRNLCSNVKIRSAIQLTSQFSFFFFCWRLKISTKAWAQSHQPQVFRRLSVWDCRALRCVQLT